MRPILLAVLTAAALAGVAAARDYHVGSLTVSHPWSRPTPPGAPTAVGYLTITNRGQAPDRLVSADTPVAAKLTAHSMSMTGGVMRMRPIPGGLEISPGATVRLDPNGDHLMFEGLKRPLRLGDHVPAVLHFQHAGAIKVEFEVESGQPAMPMH